MDRWRRLLDDRARQERQRGPATRRQVLACTLTLLVTGALLAWSLRIAPGDPLFYPATLALAVVLVGGSFLAGPAQRASIDDEDAGHRLRVGLLTGAVVLLVFLAGAAVVAQVPFLRGPVEQLLDHASLGSLPVVLAITVVNGIAEERFYRGALFDALAGRRAVLVTTTVYTVITGLSGIPLLALAAGVLGAVCAVLRRWTRGILAPIVCHLTWSVGMLLLLRPTLDALAP